MRTEQLLTEDAERLAERLRALEPLADVDETALRAALEASRDDPEGGTLPLPQHLREARARTDTRRADPPRSHRPLVGPVLVLAKRAFRLAFQPFLNEAFRVQVELNERLLDALTVLHEQVERQAWHERRWREEVERRLEAAEGQRAARRPLEQNPG